MANNSKMKLRPGDEVTYIPGRHADPILLTYVETMKNGMFRFFSSQFPTVEYHLEHDTDRIRSYDEQFSQEVEEKYLAFKGNDEAKKCAYQILVANRRSHA